MKRKTETQKSYEKQLKRIKQIVRRAEKKGYVFDKTVMPKKLERPNKRSVEKLKKITPNYLYKKAVAPDPETGEVIPALEARQKERKISAKKVALTRKQRKSISAQIGHFDIPDFSEVTIRNLKSYILGFPTAISGKLIAFINKLITEQGVEQVAHAVENMPDNFKHFLEATGFDSNSAIEGYCSSLIEYLPDASEQYKSDAMDAFENEEMGFVIED